MKFVTKRVLAVLLAFVLCLGGITAFSACDKKESEKYRIAVMSDIHVLSETQMGSQQTQALSDQEAKGQKMLVLSEGLLKQGIDKVVADGQDVLLIAGDLTDDGGEASHLAVARELKRAEAAGVRCFVIPGNHDINNKSRYYGGETATVVNNVTDDEFAAIYADFGYSEAINRHGDSLSYTSDLGDGYRLVAIDCSFYEISVEEGTVIGRHDARTTDSLLSWIESSLSAAKNDGATPIVMIHYPLTAHITDLLDNTSVMADRHEEISALCNNYGVKYVFTGHLHGNDIATVADENGNSFFDVETAALCNYPMPIRYFVKSDEGESLSTVFLDSIAEEYIPPIVSAEDKAAILRDLTAYAVSVVSSTMKTKVMGKLDESTVLSLLGWFGADKTASATIELASDVRENLILDFFDTPLYSNNSGKSVQEICSIYGISLPSSDYATVWELATKLICNNYGGNESLTVDSTEGILLKYSLYTAFYKLAAYDLFEKAQALAPNVRDLDLMPSMEILFKEGKLELVDNDFLAALFSLEKMQSLVEKMKKNTFLAGMITYVDFEKSEDINEVIKDLIVIVSELNIDFGTLTASTSFNGSLLNDIDFNALINTDEGYLNLGYIYDELLLGSLGTNLVNDRAPNDISIN